MSSFTDSHVQCLKLLKNEILKFGKKRKFQYNVVMTDPEVAKLRTVLGQLSSFQCDPALGQRVAEVQHRCYSFDHWSKTFDFLDIAVPEHFTDDGPFSLSRMYGLTFAIMWTAVTPDPPSELKGMEHVAACVLLAAIDYDLEMLHMSD